MPITNNSEIACESVFDTLNNSNERRVSIQNEVTTLNEKKVKRISTKKKMMMKGEKKDLNEANTKKINNIYQLFIYKQSQCLQKGQLVFKNNL